MRLPSLPPVSVEIGQGGIEVHSGAVDAQSDETPEQAEIRERNEVILAPLREEWWGEL